MAALAPGLGRGSACRSGLPEELAQVEPGVGRSRNRRLRACGVPESSSLRADRCRSKGTRGFRRPDPHRAPARARRCLGRCHRDVRHTPRALAPGAHADGVFCIRAPDCGQDDRELVSRGFRSVQHRCPMASECRGVLDGPRVPRRLFLVPRIVWGPLRKRRAFSIGLAGDAVLARTARISFWPRGQPANVGGDAGLHRSARFAPESRVQADAQALRAASVEFAAAVAV